jgi:hypothetical protein
LLKETPLRAAAKPVPTAEPVPQAVG